MKVRFSHEGGWSGGQWKFEGMSLSAFKKTYAIDPFPRKGMRAELIGPAGVIPAITSEKTRTVKGTDFDHGHEYSWQYNEPMFLVADCPFPIRVSEIWAEGYTIMMEVS